MTVLMHSRLGLRPNPDPSARISSYFVIRMRQLRQRYWLPRWAEPGDIYGTMFSATRSTNRASASELK